MIRAAFIERIRRIIYNGIPSDDSVITTGMVNNLLPDAIATAARANWTDNIKMEGCAFVNSSFYSTFSNISITKDGEFSIYNIALPEIPVGLGSNEGVAAVYVVDTKGVVSKPVIILTVNQVEYFEDLPTMNGFIGWNEGGIFKIKSPDTPLNDFTAKVRMISGGSTSLSSELNVPADYFPIMQEYILQTLGISKKIEPDVVNDGVDN